MKQPSAMEPAPDVPEEEDGLEELLLQVGARQEPPAHMVEEVREAVHAQWRSMLAERAQGRRRMYAAGLAASVVFAVAVAAVLRLTTPAPQIVATIARIEGRPTFAAASGHIRTAGAASAERAVGEPIVAGESLSTDGESRIALLVRSAASVRIDRNSVVRVAASDRFVLDSGALYVDVPPGAGAEAVRDLVIETRAGLVRHLGTQFHVRQGEDYVEISVREGRVRLEGAGRDALASAGEQLQIAAGGEIGRASIAPHDPFWEWATLMAPPFEIENRPLADFLEWVGRETGRTVAYATPDARRLAESVRLRGSIAGLDPDTALSAVLSTTDLRRYETDNGSIGVALLAHAD